MKQSGRFCHPWQSVSPPPASSDGLQKGVCTSSLVGQLSKQVHQSLLALRLLSEPVSRLLAARYHHQNNGNLISCWRPHSGKVQSPAGVGASKCGWAGIYARQEQGKPKSLQVTPFSFDRQFSTCRQNNCQSPQLPSTSQSDQRSAQQRDKQTPVSLSQEFHSTLPSKSKGQHNAASSPQRKFMEEVDILCKVLAAADRWSDGVTQALKKLPFQITANHVLESLKRNLHTRLALSLFLWIRQLNGYKHNNFTYNTIVNIAVRAQEFRFLEQILRCLQQDNCVLGTKTCNALLQGYGKAHKVEEALAIFSQMGGHWYARPDVRTWNVLLHMLVKENELDRVPGLYQEMIDAGYRPDIFTCNIWMSYLCACQKLEEGYKWLDAMPCPSDMVSYTTLLDGFCKTGKLLEAYLLYGQMLEEDISSDVFVFSCLIDGFCKKDNLTEAWNLFKYMDVKGTKPNVVTYTTLVDKMLKIGKTEGALGLLNVMQSRDCAPNVYLCTAQIDSLCKRGQFDAALSLLRQMNESGCLANTVTYCSIIDGLLKAGDYSKASELLKEMRSKSVTPNEYLYSSLIYSFAKAGEHAKAKLILEESLSRNPSPNVRILNCWMSGLHKTYRVDEAYELFLNLRAEGFIPNTISYNILITGFCKTNRLGLAKTMFQGIINQKCIPDLSSYTNMVKGFCSIGDVSHASRWLTHSNRKGFVHVFRFHVYTILRIFRLGKIAQAKKFLQTLSLSCIYSSAADKNLSYRLMRCRSYHSARGALSYWKRIRGDYIFQLER